MAADESDLAEMLGRLNDQVIDKVGGVGEYDLRRPLTPSGSSLLGIVKHLATVQAGYFGDVFGRPFAEPLPWTEEGAPRDADLWATADESSEYILDLYRSSWKHSMETLAANELDATGTVPWWPEDVRHPTLERILVHMLAETARHAGHIDVLREGVDGVAGRYGGDAMVHWDDPDERAAYVASVAAAAEEAAGRQ